LIRSPTYLPLWAVVPALLLVAQVQLIFGVGYSLDDPYIHLALARQILHGHYGINPGEISAPSSSVLWPFLLAPFSFTRLVEFLPLVINLGALTVTVWWLVRWLEDYMPSWWALVATMGFAFALNLYGLVLSGMENSLQVALTIVVAISLLRARFGWPFWVAVTLLPLIRYEGLAISLPALAWLFLTSQHRGKAVVSGAVIVAVVGGFSLFLYTHGVGFLPASVMARNGLRMLQEVRGWDAILDHIEHQAVFVAFAVLAAGLMLREGRPGAALMLIAVPTALHLLFGQYGRFGRYHIYYAAWVSLFLFAAWMRAGFGRLVPVNAALVAAFAWASIDPMIATLTTPTGSRNTFDQQRQMAIIARDYLDEPVAVTDLGVVAFLGRHYVLDLGGLASYEALLAQGDRRTDLWVRRLMDEHKVEHAMVYDSWTKPANWIHVGTLTLPLPWTTSGDDHVVFYSTSPEAAARLRKALIAYRQSSHQAAMMMRLEP